MWRRTLFVVAALSISGWLPAVAKAADLTRPIPLEYFGLHIHRMVHAQPWSPHGKKTTAWPGIRFGSWRLWDAYVAWPNLEPERGQWDFKTLDQYVALADKAGVDLVLPLGLSPKWASVRPNEHSKYQPGNAAEPENMEDWRNYVRTVGLRYKGRIKNYELWNEVNLPGFYSGSKEKLIELARVAYEILKGIDPNIVFASPSVTGSGNHVWLDEYLDKGGKKYLDVVSYHFYAPKSSPEAMLPIIEEVKGVMRKHGLENKQLWNTETGWWMTNKNKTKRTGAVEANWRELGEKRAAIYVAQSLILSRSAGISRFYWYAWDNTNMGLIEPGSQELKPAAFAYDKVVDWLVNAKLQRCEPAGTVWICPLTTASATRAWLLWNDDGVRDWAIPAEWHIESGETLDGGSITLNGRTIQLDEAPMLLTSKDVVTVK
jgi:hypothetical protein